MIQKATLPYLTWAFFEPSVIGGGGGGMNPPLHYNFVVIAVMIMKFVSIKLDVFYTVVTKKFVTSLQLRNYDVITCILTDM